MMFKSIDPKALTENVFSMLSDRWMLITAGNRDNCNTMTASWGGLGVLWNKNVATCYVRPQRHTRAFIDKENYFTLTFYGEDYRDALKLCGAKSGREVDKINECGFSLDYAAGDAPYFQEAELVLVCKKLYRDTVKPECFTDVSINENYPLKDYHYLYIAEIVEVLQKA